jgi:hypothetical protein
VAGAAVVARQAEVQADRLGVADVQVAVRLGREARADLRRIERRAGVGGGRAGLAGPGDAGVLAGSEVGLDDLADEWSARRS